MITEPDRIEVGAILDGRRAVVTGGGGGIGRGITQALAAAGARVCICEIVPELADETAALVPGLDVVVGDIRDRGVVQELREGAGPADILVNNVGHYVKNQFFVDSSEDDWQAVYETNLLHVFRVTHAFLPAMIEAGRGSIVNVSTVESIRGYPFGIVYGAFKAGVTHFTKCLAAEVAAKGIRVNAIAPDLVESIQVPYSDWVSDDQRAFIPRWVPLGRFGQPEDLADVVLFLASDLSRFVTGVTIPTDGGSLAMSGWFPLKSGKWTNRPRL